MAITYPAYCRKCDRITGHERVFGMKTKCVRCNDLQPVPLGRWFAATLFFLTAFGMAFYLLYSSLRVLWPLFVLPFIDYDVACFVAMVLLIPGYVAFAWVVGKLIK